MKKWQVRVRVAPSQGGGERVLTVEAFAHSLALLEAAYKLALAGVELWDLVSCTEQVTS